MAEKKPGNAAERESAGEGTGQGYGFGTFKGVFTPSILTILGVVMYLRFGWVLGNVGLARTLIIVSLATSITFLTGLSLSALATNMKVGGGGAYYIISRSLGLEPGAAIGLPLFFAQALGIAFYVSGFSEAVVDVLPGLSPRMVAVGTLLILMIIAFISADLAMKTQFVIMVLIVASLVSFFMGGKEIAPVSDAVTALPPRQMFWVVFAVFFPAVTGIEAGIAMSGDLKNPARSLPLGTVAAVLTGFAVYMAIPVFLSRVVPDQGVLLTDALIMRRVAKWGVLILLGVWAATLSSAMGSLLGAPRTLQALAKDGVLPRFIGKGFGRTNDPHIATGMSCLVALTAILLGDLNTIAPVLTMFFLTSYGLLNVSAGLEKLIGSPSWRPKFRIPAAVSLLGAFACFSAMLMINAGATFVAVFVIGAVYYVMKRRSLNVQWGDMRYGILMLIARYAIRGLAKKKPDERTWKPNILALSGSPMARWHLIEFAHAMAQGESCLTVATVIPVETWSSERVTAAEKSISDYLAKRGVSALVKVLPSDDIVGGAEALIRAYGFGPITPNTILLGWTEKEENFVGFARLIRMICRMGQNLLLVREPDNVTEASPPKKERIDAWIRGDPRNVGFVLTLAYLLTRDEEWSDARLVLKTIVESEADVEEGRKRLERIIGAQRLAAESEVLVGKPGDAFATIKESSKDADMVFMGMRAPEDEESLESYSEYYRSLLTQTTGLPVVAMALASEEIEFHRLTQVS